ncbi:MAG: DUF6273 domain-containing protein [Clostridiales Family XIII bacterium]|jgi:hypothetical protein|nr:DUF6273 domain-containing protein [Clostridiales Family XIII bacterium]
MKKINRGDIVAFGTWREEQLKWRVLEVQHNRALIITEEIIEKRPYDIEYNSTVTWEICTLRDWLNEEFFSKFNPQERLAIIETKLENKGNGKIPGGNETMDRIFLLSRDEATKYFNNDVDRIANDSSGKASFWWLRSPSEIGDLGGGDSAANVLSGGEIYDHGHLVDIEYVGVRPALWIDLKSTNNEPEYMGVKNQDGKRIIQIAAGGANTVALKKDGTVEAIGDNSYHQFEVSEWDGIIAIAVGGAHVVGLKRDRTVVAIGSTPNPNSPEYYIHQALARSKGNDVLTKECDVDDWKDIVSISAGLMHTVGLKSDGTVVSVGSGDNSSACDVDDWNDIIAISAGGNQTVGLKSNGTIVSTDKGSESNTWRDIVAVSTGHLGFTVGLRVDGSVVSYKTLNNSYCVGDWLDLECVVDISVGAAHAVGLNEDGTVVAVGFNAQGQCNVEDWSDIIAISAGDFHTVGLRSDGMIVAVGDNEYGKCNVGKWNYEPGKNGVENISDSYEPLFVDIDDDEMPF